MKKIAEIIEQHNKLMRNNDFAQFESDSELYDRTIYPIEHWRDRINRINQATISELNKLILDSKEQRQLPCGEIFCTECEHCEANTMNKEEK